MQVVEGRRLADPPLMRLESEGGHAYLSMLLQLSASQTQAEQQAEVEARLVALSMATLQRFQVHTHGHTHAGKTTNLDPTPYVMAMSALSEYCPGRTQGCHLLVEPITPCSAVPAFVQTPFVCRLVW